MEIMILDDATYRIRRCFWKFYESSY